jgi:ligand-binding SRPBCC domain-containing protein
MAMHILERKLLLPIKVKEAWDFFSNPANLTQITPPWLAFKMTTDAPGRIYPGLILAYEVSPLAGIPVKWVTEITQVKEPDYFIDDQRIGPYKLWHHQHRFKEIRGGTEIIDIVHYALPLGPIGDIANKFIVKKQLKEIFDYREEYLKTKFGELL